MGPLSMKDSFGRGSVTNGLTEEFCVFRKIDRMRSYTVDNEPKLSSAGGRGRSWAVSVGTAKERGRSGLGLGELTGRF